MTRAVTQELVLDVLAAYRLTRLVTKDSILDGPRDKIIEAAYVKDGRRGRAVREMQEQQGRLDLAPGSWLDYAIDDDRAPKMAKLVTCMWCSGFYVSVGVVIARRVAPRAWNAVGKAFALSAGAALTAGLER